MGFRAIGDMAREVYDQDRDDRIEKDALEIALNKILLGAGAGADPTEVDMPSTREIITGSYTGDGEAGRQITTGFKCSLVIILTTNGQAGDEMSIAIPGMSIKSSGANTNDNLLYHSIHATDGFTVGEEPQNNTGATYYYLAISE